MASTTLSLPCKSHGLVFSKLPFSEKALQEPFMQVVASGATINAQFERLLVGCLVDSTPAFRARCDIAIEQMWHNQRFQVESKWDHMTLEQLGSDPEDTDLLIGLPALKARAIASKQPCWYCVSLNCSETSLLELLATAQARADFI